MTSWLFQPAGVYTQFFRMFSPRRDLARPPGLGLAQCMGGKPRPNRSDSSIELGSRQGSVVRRPLESVPLDRPLHPPWPRRKIPSPTTSSLIAIRQDDDSSPCHSWLSRRSPACPSP